MVIFKWDDSYSVGIAQVDEQHKVLVDLVNRLDQAVSTGHDEAALRKILGELLDYTRYHFSTEENLMLSSGQNPLHYRKHKSEHDDFIQRVKEFSGQLRGSSTGLSEPLLDFLIKWLVDHILGSDKEMGRFLVGAQHSRPRFGAPAADLDESRRRAADLEAAERKLLGALRESELRFRVLADSVPVLIWMSGPDGRRSFFNRPWLDFTGHALQALEGRGWLSCMHPDDRQGYLDACESARGEDHYTVEFRLRRKDGQDCWFLETAVPRYLQQKFVGYVGSCVDITARKLAERVLEDARDRLEQEVAERTAELLQANRNLEKEKEEQRLLIRKLEEAQTQLLQSEKMASIGQLAAGVAHEINNPVGYVKSNLNTLTDYISDLLQLIALYEQHQSELGGAAVSAIEQTKQAIDFAFLKEDMTTLLEESQEGVNRVQHIVQDLKEFSHVDEAEWQCVDLHKGLDSTLNLVYNELKYKAQVVKEYGEIPEIRCLPQQLNQVFMNLLVNAAQALEEHGTITLRTYADGQTVTVEVEDTGPGIPPEKLNRIFEPFFTTKPVGKGTGLGLSIAYGIVSKHGGSIEVESEPGRGTVFKVRLPIASDELIAAEA